MSEKENSVSDTLISTSSLGRITPKVTSQIQEYYISGYLKPPEEYIEWFDAIRHANPEDSIKIYINSYGGDLFAGLQFMRVLAETQATVICSVEGACMSAATMIFLSADQYEITPNSSFMIHNYSGGTFGKGGEMYDSIVHERKWSERLLHEVYDGFLSNTEIKALLDNKDLWMDVDEVTLRMEEREKYFTAKEQTYAEQEDNPGIS